MMPRPSARASLLLLGGVQRGEVVEEHAIDEARAAADFAEEDARGRLVEEREEAQGEGAAHLQPPRGKRALACEGGELAMLQ